MKKIQKALSCCLDATQVINEVITKSEEVIDEVNQIIDLSKIKVTDEKAESNILHSDHSLVEECPPGDSAIAVNKADDGENTPTVNKADDGENTPKIKQYYAVINFSTKHKFKLKEKNKQKCTIYEAFSTKQQAVLFKRKINDWRHIATGRIEIIPEYTKEQNLHFNIIYFAYDDITVKDMKIAFCDAYNIPWAQRNLAVNIQEVHDYNRLKETYLKKTEGKQYQYTGIYWDLYNV